MILFFGLLVLFCVCIYVAYKSYSFDIGFGLLAIIFGTCLIFHSIFYFSADYRTAIFITEINASQKTLTESRNNKNALESATITKEVLKLNTDLEIAKYNNRTWFLKQYVSDEIQNVKPIK